MKPALARILRAIAKGAGPALASTASTIARDELVARLPKHRAVAAAAVDSAGAVVGSMLSGGSLSLSAGAVITQALADLDDETFALVELAVGAARELRTQKPG